MLEIHDVHPTDKLDVGHRLALLARRDVYGEAFASGPLFKGFSIEGDKVRVKFSETGSGLVIGQTPWRTSGVPALPVDTLLGFFIAGQTASGMKQEHR